jgi:uncharacterized membrane protein (DUF106 family)
MLTQQALMKGYDVIAYARDLEKLDIKDSKLQVVQGELKDQSAQSLMLSAVPHLPVFAPAQVFLDLQSSEYFHPVCANLTPPDLLKSYRAIEKSPILL